MVAKVRQEVQRDDILGGRRETCASGDSIKTTIGSRGSIGSSRTGGFWHKRPVRAVLHNLASSRSDVIIWLISCDSVVPDDNRHISMNGKVAIFKKVFVYRPNPSGSEAIYSRSYDG
ncbi:hypothetical protein J6590_087920 [Homalodisca vitripennis]|nr:hypothetical protein J6590_087920 [Homalodisca vitripennis]